MKKNIGTALGIIGMASAVFALVCFVIVQIYTHFSSSTTHEPMLHLAYWEQPEHTPRFNTLNVENVKGRKLEAMNLEQIKADYANAWLTLNKSQNEAATPAMEHFFAKKIVAKTNEIAAKNPYKNVIIEQTDLTHSLNFHLFSHDGQVVNFSDSNVLVKQRILNKKDKSLIISQLQQKNYDVVMVLNDGNWRIRHIVCTGINDSIKTASPLKSRQDMIKVEGKKMMLNDAIFVPRGINYYPAKHNWLDMWEHFDSPTIAKDFKTMADLGANTVRIFVPFHSFGRGNVKANYLEKLDTVLLHGEQNNLKIIVTLFDFIHNYNLDNWAKSDRHLEVILSRYKNNPTVLAWDIKNEADLDYKDHSQFFVEEWLHFLLSRIKQYDPNHLVTIGWSKPENAAQFADMVDFVSFHYYENPNDLGKKIDDLQAKVGEKPLLLEEFGKSTYHSFFYKNSSNEQEQYNYIAQTRQILKQKNDVGYVFWTLYDFENMPNYVVGKGFFAKKIQQHFGLFDKNQQAKPASTLLKAEADLSEKNETQMSKYFYAPYFLLFGLLLFGFVFWKKKFN